MSMNKILIMLPIMFAARKLDGEDPKTVYLLRCTYFTVQSIIIGFVVYLYIRAQALAKSSNDKNKVVYVPIPATPFASKDAKKQFRKIEFGAHVASTANSLLISTLFGIAMTSGLHFYKGMVVGLAMQSIMTPLNLYENALAKALIRGKLKSEEKIFEEKTREEITNDDEIVDETGNVIKPDETCPAIKPEQEEKKSFEDLLLDTWDAGAEADIGPLMEALDHETIHFKTKENGWTPIMIMSAIGVKQTASALRQMKGLGADPHAIDVEGWNALHWSAFHGSVEGAKFLLSKDGFDGLATGLHTVKDKENKTPLHHARAEGNDDVANLIDKMTATPSNGSSSSSSSSSDNEDDEPPKDEGLRKRK